MRTIRIDARRGPVGAAIIVPYGTLIHDARYSRDGADLVLTGHTGLRVVLDGYFDRGDQPALTTQQGACLAGSLVGVLVGVPDDQSDPSRLSPTTVGRVGRIRGRCAILRANGALEAAESGSALRAGDLIRTESDSTTAIELTDGTALDLGPETRLVLKGRDEHPSDDTGITLVKGTIYCSTSNVSGGGDRKFRTTLAKITPRGRVQFSVTSNGKEDRVARLSDEHGGRGRVLVGNDAGVVALSRVDQATIVADAALEPAHPFKLSASEADGLRDPAASHDQTGRVTGEVVIFPNRAMR
jgi:hypothetical protein